MARQYVAGVRVIAGTLRGRRLEAPKGTGTRPTAGRVREATFNALTSMDVLDGARVLDAFAGSGALGIEALSRGAVHCTFVERDRAALAALRTNLERCGLGPDRASVRTGAAESVTGEWDLALLDPPYAFDDWQALLDHLRPEVAVCESGRPVPPPTGWAVVREKAYGATVVTILRHDPQLPGHTGPAPEEEPA
jgi:16S rRNA (guanine966-N2)-methyltransferase